MLGATPVSVGSSSETADVTDSTADVTDSETAVATDSTPGLELTVSGTTPPVAVSAASSEDADSTLSAGADGTAVGSGAAVATLSAGSDGTVAGSGIMGERLALLAGTASGGKSVPYVEGWARGKACVIGSGYICG